MIESFAERIAISIERLNDGKKVSVPVMKFAIISVFTTSLTILLTLLFGLITRHFWPTVLAMVSFAVLRNLSGGYHFKSPMVCVVASTAVLVAIPLIPVSDPFILILTGISAVLTAIFAPARLAGTTRIPQRYFPLMKWAAVAVVVCNFLLQSPVLALTFFIQSISLLPLKEV
jgi:accessory gene regulator B